MNSSPALDWWCSYSRLPTDGYRAVLAIIALSFCFTGVAWSQEPSVDISDVRVGFDHTAKSRHWIPIAVDVSATGIDFNGSLEIATPDANGVPVSFLLDNIHVSSNTTRTIKHFVHWDASFAMIRFVLRDANGERVARHDYEGYDPANASGINNLAPGATLVVCVANKGGFSVEQTMPTDSVGAMFDTTVVTVDRVDELPVQWFAYGGVDVLYLPTSDQVTLDALSPAQQAAIRTWVRQGGHLVVTVANNGPVVSDSFLGEMLPARIDGVDSVKGLAPQVRWIEGIAGGKKALPIDDKGMLIARLSEPRGKTLPEGQEDARKAPLIVRGSFGLGIVTLVGIDTDTAPFRDWSDRASFWQQLLDLQPPPADEAAALRNPWGDADVSNWLDDYLNEFPNVAIVPFSTVALLILGYILLIGPIDYFFLKRVIGRMEFTWITFPLIVVLVSVGAYFSALWLKGDDLRLNRLDIVDVDVSSGLLRGQSLMCLFSPVIGRYSLTTEPGLAATGPLSELEKSRASIDRVVSAMGAHAAGAYFGSPTVGLMEGGGYSFAGAEPTAILGAPIRVWSVKSFRGNWLAQGSSPVTAELRAGDLLKSEPSLVGTLEWTRPEPLRDVHLFWQDRVFLIGTLEAGKPVTLNLDMQRSSNSLLSAGRVQDDPMGFLFDLTFSTKSRPVRAELPSRVLSDWSLKPQLDLGKAILVGQTSAAGGKVWINERPTPDADPPPIRGEERRSTFVRVALEPRNP